MTKQVRMKVTSDQDHREVLLVPNYSLTRIGVQYWIDLVDFALRSWARAQSEKLSDEIIEDRRLYLFTNTMAQEQDDGLLLISMPGVRGMSEFIPRVHWKRKQ